MQAPSLEIKLEVATQAWKERMRMTGLEKDKETLIKDHKAEEEKGEHNPPQKEC